MSTIYNERTFDWKSRHDPRSRGYGIRRIIGEEVQRQKRFWKPGDVLDQGQEGACVGFGWAGELAASPVRVPHVDDIFARGLYHAAQRLDEWPGESYEGTSVLAGALAVRNLGHMSEFYWCFGVDDVADATAVHGPVVIGVEYREAMFYPHPSGLVEVSGGVAGGHCMLITGYHPRMRLRGEGFLRRFEVFRVRQSWGKGFGANGDIYVTVDGMEDLLRNGGEACVPSHRSLISAV